MVDQSGVIGNPVRLRCQSTHQYQSYHAGSLGERTWVFVEPEQRSPCHPKQRLLPARRHCSDGWKWESALVTLRGSDTPGGQPVAVLLTETKRQEIGGEKFVRLLVIPEVRVSKTSSCRKSPLKKCIC